MNTWRECMYLLQLLTHYELGCFQVPTCIQHIRETAVTKDAGIVIFIIFITNSSISFASTSHKDLFISFRGTLTFSSGGQAVSHYRSNAPYCLASMQIQPCWLMLGVVSARMLMSWHVCSMLNRKKTGIAVKANTTSQMKAKIYVTMMNCWDKSTVPEVREMWHWGSGVSLINVLSSNQQSTISHDSVWKSQTQIASRCD